MCAHLYLCVMLVCLSACACKCLCVSICGNSPQDSEVDGFGDGDSGGVTVLKYTVHGCGAWRDSLQGRGCAGGVIQRCCLNHSDGGTGSGSGGGYWPTSESGGMSLCSHKHAAITRMFFYWRRAVDHAVINGPCKSVALNHQSICDRITCCFR